MLDSCRAVADGHQLLAVDRLCLLGGLGARTARAKGRKGGTAELQDAAGTNALLVDAGAHAGAGAETAAT